MCVYVYFLIYFIYLAVLGLSRGTQDLLSSSQPAGSLVAACRI